MFCFKSKIIKNDVTLIKLISKYIFCGIGDTIFIYNQIDHKLLKKIRTFSGDNIQGIDFNPSKNYLLVHGGVNVKIFKTEFDNLAFEAHTFSCTNDWILAAKWLSNGNDFVVVHMNNQITLYNRDAVAKETILCRDKCILYSAYICNNIWEDVVILSGTVFNEILIWKPSKHDDRTKTSQVLSRLKGHTGVIFSIDYHEEMGYICSSSDDRSSVLWSIPSKKIQEELKQPSVNIAQKCKVFGHESRVFRNKILKDHFITAGEDSLLNIWNFKGDHLRTIENNQGSCIWALDSDGKDIISGGGDGGVCIFSTNLNTTLKKFSLSKTASPKSIKIVRESNLVITSESGSLFYYLSNSGKILEISHHEELGSYSLLQSSDCGKLISLSGYQGQIYIYRALEDNLRFSFKFQTPNEERIFSFHWLSCEKCLTCGPNGLLSYWDLKDKQLELISKFALPKSRERWSTSACQLPNNNFIVGDRTGNIFVYNIETTDPIQTFKRLHNHLGITELYFVDNQVFSLGRNSVLNTFGFINNILELKSSNKVPFKWLTNFSAKDCILSGFSGKNFVIFDLNQRRTLLDIPCGGGHRSWSFLKNENDLKFAYIKDKSITIVETDWSSIRPIDLIAGFHLSEINTVRAIKLKKSKFILISGGEDTALKISSVCDENFENLATFKTHLSSIRTLDVAPISENSYLVVSGGGRAQIVCWKVSIDSEISCSQEYSFYEGLSADDGEVRVMDLKIVQSQVFASCSDGSIRIFEIKLLNSRYRLNFLKKVDYKLKCILKIHTFFIRDKLLLISMATDGFLVFWDFTNIHHDNLKPFEEIPAHQSGINSHSMKLISEDLMICLTGGDDNAIVVKLLKILVNEKVSVQVISKFSDFGTHCAQITGAYLGDNFFLTASIDQRVAFFSWKIESDELICEYLDRYDSAVADVQGIQCSSNDDNEIDLFLYGRGLEYFKCIR